MKINHNFKLPYDNDFYTSVFNLHDIDEINANKAYEYIYGKKKYRELRKLIDEKHKGIMGIFLEEPTDDLQLYILMITQTMNNRLENK